MDGDGNTPGAGRKATAYRPGDAADGNLGQPIAAVDSDAGRSAGRAGLLSTAAAARAGGLVRQAGDVAAGHDVDQRTGVLCMEDVSTCELGSGTVLLLFLLSTFMGACSTGATGSNSESRQTVLLSEFSYGGDTDAFIHVLDGQDLSPIARIAALDPHTGVKPVPGGEKLLAAESIQEAERGCCALYLLDLVAGNRCRLHSPLAGYVSSADGALAYSQRGNTPISIFDLESASRVGTLDSDDETFELSPSPDGRWLAAASRFSLDGRHRIQFFDAETHEHAASSSHDFRALTWQEGRLHGLTQGEDGWRLLSIRPPDGELVAERKLEDLGIQVPAKARLTLASAGRTMFLHVMISDWMRFQDRGSVRADAPGGVFVLDADLTQKARHLLPQHDLGMVVASGDGSMLYALVSNSKVPRLFALETATGKILAERNLLGVGPGRWSLNAAELSARALAVTGDRSLGPCPNNQAKSDP